MRGRRPRRCSRRRVERDDVDALPAPSTLVTSPVPRSASIRPDGGTAAARPIALRRDPADRPADPGAARPAASSSPRTRSLIRMDLAEMLTEEGYDVVGQAGDGAKAIELAEELRPTW